MGSEPWRTAHLALTCNRSQGNELSNYIQMHMYHKILSNWDLVSSARRCMRLLGILGALVRGVAVTRALHMHWR